ncbi:MAG: GTP-sensing pleiotropic transcriptional regulator CodY [Lachnospiraceae bacterium]|nr:GTP-sensing pleiotropic transcriptional regulator CodY [Lachnospiraceae bacterium]
MSSIDLLDKTRKINRLLHNNNSSKVVFNDICAVMRDVLDSSVFVISKKGKVLGVKDQKGQEPLAKKSIGDFIDPRFNDRFLNILSTKENVNLETLGFSKEDAKKYQALVTPIDIAGARLGTLFIYRVKESYSIDDIILCEYGSTVVGLEMLRSVSEEDANQKRLINDAKAAISTMTGTEHEAIVQIFDELAGTEGVLVASKIADRAGITRSVIVNALRKLESAGVIKSKSAGMKGTYIKVLNDSIYDEIEELKKGIR